MPKSSSGKVGIVGIAKGDKVFSYNPLKYFYK